MKLIKTTICAFGILAILSACEKEEKDPCLETIEAYYNDLDDVWFKVNDSDTLLLNYGAQSFDGDPPVDYIYTVEGTGTTKDLHMNFTRILVSGEDCVAERAHRVVINAQINQLPSESKTYTIGSALSQTNFLNNAVYQGDALNEDEVMRFSYGDSCGTLTLTKFVDGSQLVGSFEININGILTEGGFDIDMNKTY